jgi:hypothetical protein
MQKSNLIAAIQFGPFDNHPFVERFTWSAIVFPRPANQQQIAPRCKR